MGQTGTETRGQRIPVSVLTGFLGSGKTTILNHLIRHPDLARTVVIINEFGEIGLDHDLVETSTEDMILLNSGCLCCTVRGDLVDTLRDLFLRRVRGEMILFDRVLIETTGLADPAPILHTLMTDALVAARYRLDGVLTTIDAATAEASLDRQFEAVRQAAVADRLIFTKTDLADEASAARLTARLRKINPAAPLLTAVSGAVAPAALFDAGLFNPKTKTLDVQRWLNAEAYDHGHHHHHEGIGGHDHHNHHHDDGPHRHDVNRHDDEIRATCITIDEPLRDSALGLWLEVLTAFKGPDLLRIKGIINVAGLDVPVVIHGVQHVFHPPVKLKEWPSDDRRSRIVFITRDLDETVLRDTLRTLNAAEAERPELPRDKSGDGDVAGFEGQP